MLLIIPGPNGPDLWGRPVPSLEDVLPGEDPEDELRLLPGLRCAGHDEVRPRLQPQLLTHFLFWEKHLRKTQGGVLQEELRGQFLLVIMEL